MNKENLLRGISVQWWTVLVLQILLLLFIYFYLCYLWTETQGSCCVVNRTCGDDESEGSCHGEQKPCLDLCPFSLHIRVRRRLMQEYHFFTLVFDAMGRWLTVITALMLFSRMLFINFIWRLQILVCIK